MTADTEICAACGEKLKYGMFGSNVPLPPEDLSLINAATGSSRLAACQKCAGDELDESRRTLVTERASARRMLERGTQDVPILSIHAPPRWSFRPLGIVTAQSTTGTGLFSDVASAFTDVFGAQSNVYNSKIRAGEDLCKASLRLQTLQQGGNAVLAVDVDYSEVGGQRAMLMVCMTGTAIALENADIIGEGMVARLAELQKSAQRLAVLNSLKLPVQ